MPQGSVTTWRDAMWWEVGGTLKGGDICIPMTDPC